MFHMGGAAVVAATFFVAVSGSAMLAAGGPAGLVVAQAPESAALRIKSDFVSRKVLSSTGRNLGLPL